MEKTTQTFASSLQNRRYSTNFNQTGFEIQCKDALVRRLNLERKLQIHEGCVNTISWDSTGRFILSGSDDLHLVIANPFAAKRSQVVAKWRTPHRSNIFSAEFLPDSSDAGTDVSRVVSASCDGLVCVTDLNALETHRFTPFGCHSGTVYQVHTLRSQSSLFFSCSEDGTLRQFDLREPCACRCNTSPLSRRTRCRNHVVTDCGKPVTALAVSPTQSHLIGLAVADGSVRLYDRRMVEQSQPQLQPASSTTSILHGMVGRFSPPCARDARSSRITALQFAPDGLELLASFYGAHLYLVSTVECVPDKEAFRLLEDLSKPTCKANTRPDQAPSIRRIRLRGDWSDTGPSAMPEADRQRHVGEAVTGSDARDRVMDRFSELLTGLFDVRSRSTAAAQTGETPDTSQQARPSADVGQDTRLNSRNEQSEVESTGSQDVQIGSSNEPDTQNEEARRTELKRCVSAFRERRRREAEHLDQLGMLKPIRSFTGHRNSRTMIKKATFWGDQHVLSGSDCGHVFIWDRYTASVVGVLEADRHVVNCLQPHPHLPLLATSGIDYDVKLWTPCSAEPPVSEERMAALIERNARMLQETAGTYTLPSALIIRMLAAIRDSRMRNVSERRDSGSNSNAVAEPSDQNVARIASSDDNEEDESDDDIDDASYA